MIDGPATITSDEGFQSTTLTIDVTKLDNSTEGTLGVVIRFGDVQCESRRPYQVFQGTGESGALFKGDQGIHVLKCQPFTPASDFEGLPKGRVVQPD